jgi:phage-related baseplate assembly protein
MAVSAAIADASVESSAPGRVDVAVLGWELVPAATADADAAALGQRLFPAAPGATGQAVVVAANDSALLGAVRTALSAETVRPLTDQVVVVSPTITAFSITARLRVYRGPDPATVLQQSTAALAAYLTRVRRLGYDVTRAGIIAALGVPAVQNVLLDSPAADIVCTPAQIADPHPITVVVEGAAE